MTERLHGQVGGETQAGQVFQLVPGHGPGGVLGADSGHQGFAVSAGANAVGAAGLAHHLLGQGETLAGVDGDLGCAEQVRGAQAQWLPLHG